MNPALKLLAVCVLACAPVCYSEDWGQAVIAALAAAGNHDTVVDMTAMTGSQYSSVNPFAALTGSANVAVKIGCYDITTSAPWVINASPVRVEFCSSGSQLKAASNFPPAPLITVGNNTFPIQNVLIEHGYLNCENVPLANGANQHRIRDITCNNASGTSTGKAGVHITASGYSQTLAVVERVHVEGFNDGVFFDNRVSGTASDIDCTNGCGNGVHIGFFVFGHRALGNYGDIGDKHYS